MSGKTTLAKKKAESLQKVKGRHNIVLDPFLDPEWKADFITNKQDEFLKAVWGNRNCNIFIDESGSSVGKFNTLMDELATRGRHWGHKVYFICQRSKMISTTVRSQCSELAIFKNSRNDTQDLADEFVEPMILEADKLAKGEFIYVRDGLETIKLNVFEL